MQQGDATGYAYVEDLDWEAMKRAAETAAQIATGGGGTRSLEPSRSRASRAATTSTRSRSTCPAWTSARSSSARAAAAHAVDPRVIKAEASFAEEIREILVATSDGKLAHDVQPLMRFGVRVIAEQDGKRQEGSSGGGGRMTLGYFDDKSPEWHAREAARAGDRDARRARSAGRRRWRSCSRPGDSGILLHEAVGHGLEADFNRKGTSNYTGQIGNAVASELCTVVDDATLLQSRGTINVDDEGNEPRAQRAHRERHARRLHARPALSAKHFKLSPTGNGRRESFACRADAAHDQHHPRSRARTTPRRS